MVPAPINYSRDRTSREIHTRAACPLVASARSIGNDRIDMRGNIAI
jgi:hypothetical protein